MGKRIVARAILLLTDVSECRRDEEGKSQVEYPIACSRNAYTLGPVPEGEHF
jgi:hypothetical protein